MSDEGLLLIDKSAGVTSHDVVQQVRIALGIRRVGHTGTLDPFATGLLLLLVGPFTRLAEFYHALPKTYEATIELGLETDSDDHTGATVTQSDAWRALSGAAVRQALAGFEGEGLQVPSTYSAVRVKGRRAHDLARRGAPAELEPRSVTFHELELTDFDPPRVALRASVSTGTFIRALARDLGRELGVGGHLSSLRRTSIGPFDVEDAVLAAKVEEGPSSPEGWRMGTDALPWIPQRRLSASERADVRMGRQVELGEIESQAWAPGRGDGPAGDLVALVGDEGLVAIAVTRGDRIHPRKVFAA